ncbi:MAG TPA: methionine--tRNA ligase [Patescibacteria group bacterium]|nr:methionine--tRNA ligase [Patescibacteria group bacterium]
MNKFYVTTAIPYVNAKPHIGHALEFVQADAVARYHRLINHEVKFLTGSDENAIKNVKAAEEAGVPVQEFIDKNAELFKQLGEKLNISFDVFQKGSSPQHHKASQKLWELCKHDIYKKEYTGKYCVGCELFYENSELNENGECFEHPGKKLEEVSEENYFFKLSNYTEQIKKLIESDEIKIIPENRKHEVLSFLKQGLNDISISRSNERAKNWGVPVPGDPTQRMYVWFDALNIYQSGIGFGSDEKEYEKWWPADVHVIGKGILRFHAIYWPAFLLSAGLKLPKTIFVHEYITINGEKMSKSIGNVIDPVQLIEKYGTDALRLYFLKHVSPFSDGDFSEEKFKEAYNSDLANGLGNLVARVAKLCENNDINIRAISKTEAGVQNKIIFWLPEPGLEKKYIEQVENFKFNEVLNIVWQQITNLDKKIAEFKPWDNENKSKEEIEKFLADDAVLSIRDIAKLLEPFLPETAEKIEEIFKGPKVKASAPLFPRI